MLTAPRLPQPGVLDRDEFDHLIVAIRRNPSLRGAGPLADAAPPMQLEDAPMAPAPVVYATPAGGGRGRGAAK